MIVSESFAMETDAEYSPIEEIHASSSTTDVESTKLEIKEKRRSLKIKERSPTLKIITTKNRALAVKTRGGAWKKFKPVSDLTAGKRSPLTSRNGLNTSSSNKMISSPLVARSNANEPRMVVQRRQARRIESMKLAEASTPSSVGSGDFYLQRMISPAVCRTPTDKENM